MMSYGFFPFGFYVSKAASEALGAQANRVAVLALRAILSHRKSMEVAHQQIRYCGRDFVFCSHITGKGQLIIELDLGDARLSDLLILEDDLRNAECKARDVKGKE